MAANAFFITRFSKFCFSRIYAMLTTCKTSRFYFKKSKFLQPNVEWKLFESKAGNSQTTSQSGLVESSHKERFELESLSTKSRYLLYYSHKQRKTICKSSTVISTNLLEGVFRNCLTKNYFTSRVVLSQIKSW